MFLLIFNDILRYLLISLLSTFTYGTFELLIFTWYCSPSSNINFSWTSTLSNITLPLATEESIEIFLYVLFDSVTTPSTKSFLVIVMSVTTISGSSGLLGSFGLFGSSGIAGFSSSFWFPGLLMLVDDSELFWLLDPPEVAGFLSPVCVCEPSPLLLTGPFEFPVLLIVSLLTILSLILIEFFWSYSLSLESFWDIVWCLLSEIIP